MIFQQLFPLCSCTAADRTLQIMLIAATTVCVAVQRDLVPVVAVKHNRGTRGTLHLSLWILSAQRKRRSTAQVTCASMAKDELDAVISHIFRIKVPKIFLMTPEPLRHKSHSVHKAWMFTSRRLLRPHGKY